MEREERFRAAYEHAKEFLELYKQIPTGIFGAAMIQQDIYLYENGDRSNALLKSMEGIE